MNMERLSDVELQMETLRGGLKELVMRWFTESQTALVQVNGSFPDWFQGFATRKETEDLLRDKALGCFLIRLSDKALGYILSYKGQDRCRHFVITQNQDGQFRISGDSQSYRSLTELIEHYKASPIQPFGEYLTSSTLQEDTGELYDVVHFNTKSGVSVQALRSLWDQKMEQHRDPASITGVQRQRDSVPSLPLKTQSKARKLMGTVSVDTTSLSQSPPPVTKRGFPPGFSLSGSLPETTTHPSEIQMESQSSDEGNSPSPPTSDASQPGSRSQSLPHLDIDVGEEEPSSHPPTVTCLTYSLHGPTAERPGPKQHSPDLDMLKSNPLYQTSEEPVPRPGQQAGGMYAEVTQTTPAPPDDTYEPIPGETTGPDQGNTYESLAEMKSKRPKATWGKSNIKWKKFLPDYKKK